MIVVCGLIGVGTLETGRKGGVRFFADPIV